MTQLSESVSPQPRTSQPGERLLHNRPALVLLGLGTIARLPPAMIFIALLFWTQELTGSYAVAGLVSGVYVAARAAAGPGLGRLVDRIGQTKVLLVTACVDAVLLVAFAAFRSGTPSLVLVLVAVGIGVARPPLSGCVRALLPAVTGGRDLHLAYAIESIAFELTFILGPPLALAIASVWSIAGSLVVCAALLAGSTLLFVIQPVSRQWRPISKSTRTRGAMRSPSIRTFVFVLTLVGAVFGTVDVALPAALKALHHTAAAGPVLGLWGLGSLIGGVVVTRYVKGLLDGAKSLIVLLALLGLLHGALAATTASIVAMAVVVTIAGATIAPTYTNIYSAVDRLAPKGTATEAFSWLESAVSGGTAGGAALAGVLTQHYGAGSTFMLAIAFGVGAVLVASLRMTTIGGAKAGEAPTSRDVEFAAATAASQ